MTITNFLKEHQLSDIAALDTQKLVEVEDSSSVGEAFHALVSHSLHCVPVKSGEKYVGLLDIKDFVTYLIRLCKGGEVYDEAGKLSDLSHQNPFRSLPAHGTVLDVCFLLFTKSSLFPLPSFFLIEKTHRRSNCLRNMQMRNPTASNVFLSLALMERFAKCCHNQHWWNGFTSKRRNALPSFLRVC